MKMYISYSSKPIPSGKPPAILSLCENRNTHLFFFQERIYLGFIRFSWRLYRYFPHARPSGTYRMSVPSLLRSLSPPIPLRRGRVLPGRNLRKRCGLVTCGRSCRGESGHSLCATDQRRRHLLWRIRRRPLR